MTKNLSLEIKGCVLSVRRFSIREALSFPFELAVWAKSPSPDINLANVVGGPATFTVAMDRRSRSWFGVVRHAELVRAEPTGESAYVFHIVDGLWLTTQVRNYRIFQHKKLPDIVDQVLEPYQIKPKRELGGIYPDKEYIVQHGETDFELIQRLLEEAGITYFYRFEGDKPQLVISDGPHQNPERPGDPIHYVDQPHADAKTDFVTAVRLAHQTCPGQISVSDHDFRRPADFDLSAHIETREAPDKLFELEYYEPGAFLVEQGGRGSTTADDQGIARHDPEEGQALAGRKLLAARRRKRSVRFATNAMDLAPGVVFKIANYLHPELADSTKLLVGEFTLNGNAAVDWAFEGEATFADDGHPLQLNTPTRRIPGVHSAVVIAPQGEPGNEEIYTDEYGRVRVQFPWDRYGKGISEGKPSSTWMRVSQAWAGHGFGSITIPRKGQEVLVRYLEGDPEQPVVVGRVYHKLQPVPYTLPKHKAKSLIQSDTSKHKDAAYNEIRFDDRKDRELFYEQAERDRQKIVRRHETERTGNNRVVVVGKHRSQIVAEVDATLVGKQHSVQIIKPPSEDDMKVLPQRMPKLEPKPTKIDMVDEHILVTTSSATLEMADDEVIFEAKGELSIKAGGKVVVEGGPKVKINS
ncbi:MAG: type VI secretion system tip protein VgrG [Deltaproteobacteria bacterium]|jgi:type VI secretion system secreted protein VgrG|nr:type VI secretion system tip protein VgrG [Deltaproteobacteria bacterium]MBW2531559.1 type VI secretion system tip protein VgrG [Deltaproteobacteria bacterium]